MMAAMNAVAVLLAKRPKGTTLTLVAQVAGMNPSHLSQLIAGGRRPTAATLARIRLALVRLKARQHEAKGHDAALYRAVLALVATELKLDALEVQRSDPAAKMAPNAEWRAASFARWLAQYLMNCGLGLYQADVARACGVTKQAVNLAMKEIELKREQEPVFEALVARLEAVLTGVK